MMLAAVGIAVLVLAALIAVALARWISKPVLALERDTRRLADGTLPAAAPTAGPSELRRLAATFYATATRMQSLIDSQRSFIGHASHQLKTPLAALRLRLENLEPDIAPQGAKNLHAALTETDRLAQMVETLLAMARSEQTTLPRDRVALAEAVEDRLYLWTPLAAECGITLSASGSPGAAVLAVPGAVDQILDNLLSNALRAAPGGSTIRVTWCDADPVLELHVVDEGPGLTAEQRARALDPFWRAPGAAKGGTGLGLSLVSKLAEVCGGEVALRAGDAAGLDAVVTFPSAPRADREPAQAGTAAG
jgi:signal transduction histidine kinase